MKKSTDPRRQAYDEVLKAMRKRQRTRRRVSVEHAQFATQMSTSTNPADVEMRLRDEKSSREKHHEADGMSELILMVKNMRDHGADAS